MLKTFAELFHVGVLRVFGWMLPVSVLALVFVHLGRHGCLRPFADLFHAARSRGAAAPGQVTRSHGDTEVSREGWRIPQTPVTPAAVRVAELW